MLLSRHFNFLHIPRTGGTWVEDTLRHNAPGEWKVVRRLPKHGALPVDRRHLPTFAFVREPMSWYLSWYGFHYRCWVDLDHAYNLGREMYVTSPDARTRCYDAHFTLYGGEADGFRAALPWLTFAESWTGHVTEVIGDGSGVRVCRFEHLRADLAQALEEFTPGLTTKLRRAILAAPPIFEGMSIPRDDTHVDLVRARDGKLAMQLGYYL